MTKDPHKTSSIKNCRIIELQVIPDINGKLAVVDNTANAPFAIQRFFFLFDVPSQAKRGGHSHFKEEQLIMAVSGSFDVIINDGKLKKKYRLDRPDRALYITNGIWRELANFTSGAVCVVLSSTNFCEEDYVRDFEEFLSLTESKR